MEAFYMSCAGICTAALVVAAIHLVGTLQELKLTAQQARKTAAALEQLALHVDDNVKRVDTMTTKIAEFSEGLQSGWVRAAQMAAGFFSGLREGASERRAPREEERETEEV